VRVDGHPVVVAGAKERALLAILLLNANRPVAADRLIDELWGEEPPATARKSLQVRIAGLRKTLGEGAIVKRGAGYALQVDPGSLDLELFERRLANASDAQPAEAADLLGSALELWRGPALVDFAGVRFADAAGRRLEELRRLAVESRIDAELALGRHAELVADLEQLIGEHPLRERLRAQLMLALYRSGRQADALASYQAARSDLVETLGLEPSPALVELERSILRHDPALELARPSVPERAILVVPAADRAGLDALLALAEPLSRRPPRELILICAVRDRHELSAIQAELEARRSDLVAAGVLARSAAFTSPAPGRETAQAASEHDVDLLLVEGPPALLDDPELDTVLRVAPCDVAVCVGGVPSHGTVVVPFGGAGNDWGAVELGAWIAGAWQAPLHLAGPVTGERDASRLLASASLAVQRAFGVAAQPLLLEPGHRELVEVVKASALCVVGLSGRWQQEGLGSVRLALAATGRPTLLVRRGLRPGGLAPPEQLTRFTWSLAASA
jgi:DNA-binding SARP family transcriptional activator